jgi:mono/diheme cytochrome c family protein
MKTLISTLALFVLLALLGYAYVASGIYNVGADVPHSPFTYHLLSMARSRSVQRHAESLDVPKLDDPALILKGAGQYAAMCTGCHLAPGMSGSELRAGLYPQPPLLSKETVDAREAFWVIKHGIKLTAMPAWGATHDDQTIWSMVAFVRKLPGLTPAQYKDMVAKAPPDEDMDMDHDKGDMHDMHNDAKH